VRILGLSWVGTRTDEHDAVVKFFQEVLGLAVRHAEQDFTVLTVPDGSTVEVFGSDSGYNQHLTSPVAGFSVTDLDEALADLLQAGVEIVLPVRRGETGAWLHFRAPDGFCVRAQPGVVTPGQGASPAVVASFRWSFCLRRPAATVDGQLLRACSARRSAIACSARRSDCGPRVGL
jgi:predicted enzyme related to lactoylglutathione lyase